MGYQVSLTPKSSNAKTGPIPVSTTARDTCPDSCMFKNNGCYAEHGPLRLHWDKVTAGKRGTGWSEFCRKIRNLPDGQLWRHNQGGDLPGDGLTLDVLPMLRLVAANKGKRGFTYTHYPVLGDSVIEKDNREVIAQANEQGFTINLSGNSPAHADALADLNIGPVTTVLPADSVENSTTPAGRKVVVCPAVIKDNVSCASCQLCQRQRAPIVGFPAHGARKRRVSAVAEGS